MDNSGDTRTNRHRSLPGYVRAEETLNKKTNTYMDDVIK